MPVKRKDMIFRLMMWLHSAAWLTMAKRLVWFSKMRSNHHVLDSDYHDILSSALPRSKRVNTVMLQEKDWLQAVYTKSRIRRGGIAKDFASTCN